jgi:hypothetical protein
MNRIVVAQTRVPFLALSLGLAVVLAMGCVGSATPGTSTPTTGTGNAPGSGTGSAPGTGGTGIATGSGGTGSGAGTGTASGGVTGGVPVGGPLAMCPTAEIAPTPLRRLTKFEYANTIRDLLKVDAAPVADMPVDEVTDGFNNNSGVLTVSPLHAEKYVLVAEALAKAAVKSLSTLSTCNTATTGEDACAMTFARSFGRRAFRRALTAADEQFLMGAYNAGKTGGTYAEGVEVMIRAALQSPHFLYRLETTTPASALANAKLVPLNQYELATRMSFLIWGTGPDDALLDLAGRSGLGTKTEVATKARDMLKDAKAKVAVTDFYNQWMGTTRLDTLSKSTTLFPSYSASVRDAMARELPAFVNHVLWTGDHKIETLLTSQNAFVSGPLAQLYGVTAPANSTTTAQMVTLPAAQGRSGILTQAGFLAVQAHPDQTSPVLRGKFVRTKLMCQPPQPPPVDADITPPSVTEGGTARERFSAHLTAGSSCNGCHQFMDPIGFAFENYDAIGQFRTTEGGKTIDASGSIIGAPDPALAGTFTGVRELGTKLAGSDQVRDCVATQWFRFSSGRFEEPTDGCSLTTLQDAFGASGGDLVELVVAMTQTDAFWYRAPTAP